MKIKSFRVKTAMLSTEIMEKNEQLRNVRPRHGTVPCPTATTLGIVKAFMGNKVSNYGLKGTIYACDMLAEAIG